MSDLFYKQRNNLWRKTILYLRNNQSPICLPLLFHRYNKFFADFSSFLIIEPYMYYRLSELDFVGAIHLSQAIFNDEHKVSFGFKSRECPGQSNTLSFVFLKQFVIILALCDRILSLVEKLLLG